MTLYMNHPMNWYEARRQMMRRMMNGESSSDAVIRFPVEIKNDENEYVLKALLPGLTPADVKIEFSENILKIEGELKFDHAEGDDLLVDELPEGKFSRSFELNSEIDSEKIQASMANGILTVRVPKAPEAKPKTIKIKVN